MCARRAARPSSRVGLAASPSRRYHWRVRVGAAFVEGTELGAGRDLSTARKITARRRGATAWHVGGVSTPCERVTRGGHGVGPARARGVVGREHRGTSGVIAVPRPAPNSPDALVPRSGVPRRTFVDLVMARVLLPSGLLAARRGPPGLVRARAVARGGPVSLTRVVLLGAWPSVSLAFGSTDSPPRRTRRAGRDPWRCACTSRRCSGVTNVMPSPPRPARPPCGTTRCT
jgi:hypothetical protein